MFEALFQSGSSLQKNIIFILLLVLIIIIYNIIKLSIDLFSEQPKIKQQLIRRKFLDYELKDKKSVGFFKEYDTKMLKIYQKHIASNFKLITPYKFKKIERMLEISKMDSLFSPITYVLTKYLLIFIGVLFLILTISLFVRVGMNVFVFIPGFLGAACIFILPRIEKRTIDEYNSAILLDFSKFIRFMAGYLTAGKAFRDAIISTKTYLNEEWDDLLSELLKVMQREGRSRGIKEVLTKVNIEEVNGFFTLLIGSKSGDFRKDFEAEAEAVDELLQREYLKVRESRGTILSMAKMLLIGIATLILMVPLLYEILQMYTQLK